MPEQAPTTQQAPEVPAALKEKAYTGKTVGVEGHTILVVDVDKHKVPTEYADMTNMTPEKLVEDVNTIQTKIEIQRRALDQLLASPVKAIENTVQRILRREPQQIRDQRTAIYKLEKQYQARQVFGRSEYGLRINERRNPHHMRLPRGGEVNWNGMKYSVLSDRKDGIYNLVPSYKLTVPVIETKIQELKTKISEKRASLGGTIKRVQAIWNHVTAEQPNPVIVQLNELKKDLETFERLRTRRKHGYAEA